MLNREGGGAFLMIRRPPRSTLSSSSAASGVYKRQGDDRVNITFLILTNMKRKQILASEHREGGLENSY